MSAYLNSWPDVFRVVNAVLALMIAEVASGRSVALIPDRPTP